MRIFLAGATGVIGIRLVPLLLAAGHEVAGTTRSEAKAERLRQLGAEPVVVDVYEAEELRDAVIAFAPDAVMHQLTDLPDDAAELAGSRAANDRIRTEGTAKLIAAARAAAAPRFLAQSIAWTPPGSAETIAAHEAQVLAVDGVVIRYGQFYGPGTYYEDTRPEPPRISLDDAARRTLDLLDAPSGVVEITEPL